MARIIDPLGMINPVTLFLQHMIQTPSIDIISIWTRYHSLLKANLYLLHMLQMFSTKNLFLQIVLLLQHWKILVSNRSLYTAHYLIHLNQLTKIIFGI